MTEDDIRGIYGTTIDALYGYVSRRCDGDRALAEDVTQETWLRAVRSWRRIGVPEKPLAWLITVARNLMLNERRRMPALSLDAVDADRVIDISSDATHSASADNAALVRWALERLPARQRTLLEAFHFERRSTA
ncbi:MAG TPA: sigma-70 family RNA polymerase sigma factor, partial [Longimicrobiales bacterium]